MVNNSDNQKQKGGKFINSGTYGCVFTPHLKCKDVNNIPKAVGKVFNRTKYFDEEVKIANRIKKDIDPKGVFTLPPLATCQVQYIRKNDEFKKCDLAEPNMRATDYRQIIYPHGGKTLEDIHDDQTSMRGSPKTFLKLLVAFRPILEGLCKMTEHKLIHNDIKTNNIMYKKGRLYLIDFGKMVHHDEIFTRAMVHDLLDDKYWHPPEFKAFLQSRTTDVDVLYRSIMSNFRSFRHLARAFSTHLRMNAMTDFEVFYNARVPQKQYKEVCAGKIDVYALGLAILELYMWSEYHEQIYSTNSPKAVIRDMVINLIKGMVQLDPRRRSSSEEALSQLDDIIKLMECLKRPMRNVKNSPSARGQKPATRLNICVGKVLA